jgi:hypothetical protein
MSLEDEEHDAGGKPPRRGAWAMAVAFLLFLWFAIEVVSMSRLGSSGQPVFKQAEPARTSTPTAK